MKELILHHSSERSIKTLLRELPQSLLLSGEDGVGLRSIACSLADTEIAAELSPEDSKGKKDSVTGTISVEKIRQLYEQTRTKRTKKHVIIIDDADHMSLGAQSAFLKLLEEPNANVHFILTSHNPGKLLPTIRSRVQHVIMQPIDAKQTAAFIDKLGITDATKRAQLQFIASGLPAELVRLINDEGYFKTRASLITDARDFLQADTYSKLLIINKYKSNRDEALRLVASAIYILRRSISAKPQPALISQLEKLLEISERIASNHNTQLQLTQFVV